MLYYPYIPYLEKEMFEKLRDYLRMQIKTAYHTIKKSFHLFLPLLLAIFIIQSLLFTVILSTQNNIETRREKITETYDHHVVISGLNEGEMLLLRNDSRSVAGNDKCFEVIKTIRYDSANHDPTFTVYVQILSGNKNYGIFAPFINDSLETNYNAMRLRYHDVFYHGEDIPNENISLYFTPLYTQEEAASQFKLNCALSLLAISVASTLLFSYLYRIYVNDKRFIFGLYSAFGAGRRDLRREAMAEFLILALGTLLPSYYVSVLICRATYASASVPFSFSFISLSLWAMILVITAVILFFAVSFSTNKIARTDPMTLLSGEENENPISSPRRSASLLKRRFPFGYEGLSLLRFRKHHISLAIFSALLSVTFVFGSFLSIAETESVKLSKATDAHFTVSVSNMSMIPGEYIEAFRKTEGVSSVFSVPATTHARDLASLLIVSDENVANGNGLAKDKANGLAYTGDVRFISGAEDTADGIAAVYQTVGSISAFENDPESVIIGKTFENRDTFNFKVGDTITIAIPQTELKEEESTSGKTTVENIKYRDENATPIENATGKNLWRAQYENFVFTYKTFKVAGIIEDYPSATQGVPVILHPEAYQEITGTSPVVNALRIRINESAGGTTFSEVEGRLRSVAAKLGNCTVESHNNLFENQMNALYCYDGLFRTITYGFLLFIPLIWIYSQILFFKKREKEFYILNAIGAPPSAIRRIHFTGSAMMIPVAILSLTFSLLLYGGLSLFFDRFLPNVFGIENVIASSVSVPVYVYAIGILTTLISCIVSTAIPYIAFLYRSRAEKVSTDFHSEEQ